MAAAAHHLLPGDEIDPKALKLCVARFKHHHDVRLAASKHRMTRRQRNVIDVLPLLYHRNHPALPGYIDTTVPAGIPGYRATTEALGVAVGYRDPPHRAQPVDLQSIFIMGSSAQNRASDVDLWVCCESHLHPALWPKVHAVNHWARTHGVEMQTYLVDPQTFQLGHPIPGCPTPTLLLDEFYRSATLIANPAPVQVFVNSETQTEPAALRRPGFTVVTHHDDPLDFSGSHKLLLRSVDVLRADGIDDWTLESRTDGASVLQA
jgi:adenylate cyclase class 1